MQGWDFFGKKKKERITFSIYGSCVSRDLFEMEEANKFQCQEYVARHSIVSAVSKPIELKEDEICLASNFQKRIVLNDIEKSTFQLLKEKKSEYLIVDFIDERFDLIRIEDSYITKSNELVASGFLNGKEHKEIKRKKDSRGNIYIEKENIQKYMDEFILQIKKIYKPKQIILHKAFLLDEYIDKDGKTQSFGKNYLKNNKEVNYILMYMYDYFQQELPCPNILDICCTYKADEQHKWGVAPMHYQREYYEKIVELIKEIVGIL